MGESKKTPRSVSGAFFNDLGTVLSARIFPVLWNETTGTVLSLHFNYRDGSLPTNFAIKLEYNDGREPSPTISTQYPV